MFVGTALLAVAGVAGLGSAQALEKGQQRSQRQRITQADRKAAAEARKARMATGAVAAARDRRQGAGPRRRRPGCGKERQVTARGMMMKVAVLLAVAPLALAGQASAQVPAALLDSKGYLVPDYVGIANWAFSPMPATVSVGNPRVERTGSPGDSATNVLVVSPAVLPAGTLTAFETWSQAGTAGSFNAYVLRPVAGTPSAYSVVFDSGAALGAGRRAGHLRGGAACAVQAGDRIAHHGQGVPFDMSAAGMDAVYYPTAAAPAAGTTITLGDASYPAFDPAVYGQQPRTYSFGAVVNAGGMRKFVDTLPGLTAAGANNLGQYIPVAVPDTTTYPGSDYYEIELRRVHARRCTRDLPPTTLRGYVQTNSRRDADASSAVPLPGPDHRRPEGPPGPHQVHQQAARPATAGNLFIPVDTTVMGAGMGPLTAAGTPCDNTCRRTAPATPRTAPPSTCTAAAPRGSATARRTSGSPRPARPRRIPKGVSVYERARHARPGRRLADLLLHQPAERPAACSTTTTPAASPASTSTPARPPAT